MALAYLFPVFLTVKKIRSSRTPHSIVFWSPILSGRFRHGYIFSVFFFVLFSFFLFFFDAGAVAIERLRYNVRNVEYCARTVGTTETDRGSHSIARNSECSRCIVNCIWSASKDDVGLEDVPRSEISPKPDNRRRINKSYTKTTRGMRPSICCPNNY